MTIQELAETIYDEWPLKGPALNRDNMVRWLVSLITEGLAGEWKPSK